MSKPSVDQNACIGCGLCTTIAPKTFELGTNFKATVKTGKLDNEDTIQKAKESCPVNAITFRRDS